ncbi:MAG TPA: hypothetical protein VGC17_03295 [Lactovum miscens]|uniref:hypothetical protein n=1 Tax=Lactovum miscens TaxID=190387 RepID=UPI002EDAF1E9
MKKSKVIALLAVSTLSVGILAACSSSNSSSSSSKSTAASSSKAADTFTGATTPNKTFSALQNTFKSTGNWLGATGADMDATGQELTVDGTFVADGATGEAYVARKLAIYDQNSQHQVTAQYTLTVKDIVVKSPGFYISNGTVKGDVLVSALGFHAQNGKKTDGSVSQATIDGNLKFASQALLDAYNKLDATQKVVVTGTTSVDTSLAAATEVPMGAITVGTHGLVTWTFKGNGADTQSGATTGTVDASVLTKALGAKGAWLVATNGDVDASGKTISVDGIFLNEAGTVQRTLAMIAQDSNRNITKVYTLTVDKLIVNSPEFDFEGGNVKGDVYVGAKGSILSRPMTDVTGAAVQSKIDGNLYFATQDQLDTYKALPAAQQFLVTGSVAVKAAK